MKKAIIVGAGLAGLKAAVDLCDRGLRVTVLEKLGSPGGRTRRTRPVDGWPSTDMGQHLMLGCYKEALEFAARLGTLRELKRIKGVTPFVSKSGEVHPFRLGDLPSPFHLAPTIAGLTQLRLRDRLGLARVAAASKIGVRLNPDRLDSMSVAEWLKGHGQSPAAVTGFWEPLTLATQNCAIGEASSLMLATVVDKGFFSTRSAAIPILPKTTLHDAFVAPAAKVVEDAGGRICCGETVSRVVTDRHGFARAVETTRGVRYPADAVIVAVPSWNFTGLFEGDPRFAWHRTAAEALGSSPIVNVDLWFDRPWLDYPYACILGSAVQWIFSHYGEKSGPGQSSYRVTTIVSGAVDLLKSDNGRIAEICRQELSNIFPTAKEARLLKHVVVKERRATVKLGPGLGKLRPGTFTPVNNLFIAGDWTATGLPATIEGAVLSGRLAADAVADCTESRSMETVAHDDAVNS